MANEYRVTWSGVEVLDTSAGFARVTWSGLEVLRTAAATDLKARVTWIGIEVLRDYPTGTPKGKRAEINRVIQSMLVEEAYPWWQPMKRRQGLSAGRRKRPVLFTIIG